MFPKKRLKEKRSNAPAVSLYIHFPFCLYKCHYCDFNSHKMALDKIPFAMYRLALLKELDERMELSKKIKSPLNTLYFGGGTPSLMPIEEVEKIMKGVERYFTLSSSTEITLEANPKTVTVQKLRDLKSLGINRISVGVQSLHEKYLSTFGRIHTADDARDVIDWISKTGFNSWNADLIFGFPGQTALEWEKDLSEMIQMNPPHLSCYSFTVEEGTIYSHQVHQGEAPLPSDDLQAELFLMTEEKMKQLGYRHYEISNYARAGHESRHNTNYWEYTPFIGLGAGAVSFLHYDPDSPMALKENFGYRTLNFKSPNRYMQALLENKEIWFDKEEISRSTAMGEFMMMGLRLKKGVAPQKFKTLFGSSLEDHFKPVLEEYRQKGYLRSQKPALTKKGQLFSNQVMGALVSYLDR